VATDTARTTEKSYWENSKISPSASYACWAQWKCISNLFIRCHS